MADVRNILFIMSDQLRADYLSCYGHPTLKTPHIDGLAKRGVTYTRAYTPAPLCGPARASFYTGRSMFSHGSVWNFVPLSIREQLLGDLLRDHGLSVALDGKTHHRPDEVAMARLGINPETVLGRNLMNGGFEIIDRYEGHANPGPNHPYVAYLREQGYDSDDPWEDFVVSGEGPDGELLSGWYARNCHLPARVSEEHSETAYTTDIGIKFIREQGDNPWFLHLSYIKPHWPYIAPAPYHDMYGVEDCIPVVRSAEELDEAHPVYKAFTDHVDSRTFHRDDVLDIVRPVYMGLVKQLDDHLGRVFQALEETGRMEDTLVVFTSDHGDYLGDHWLDEKELYHEPSTRIPLIVYDPVSAADATRGTMDDRLVEGIDFVPTALDAVGAPVPDHLLEGLSLLPSIRGDAGAVWRDIAVSEMDYTFRDARVALGQDPRKCRGYMARGERFKYVLWEGFPPQVFDLQEDPDELHDLGTDPAYATARAELHEHLFTWIRNRKLTVTLPKEDIVLVRETILPRAGIHIGEW